MPETKLAKKAAKKVANKAAKKVAKKAAKKTPKGPGHDARRAYEHLQRLRILHPQLGEEALSQLNTISKFAQAAFAQDDAKSAAELLRAGEHLAFGFLAGQTSGDDVSSSLRTELKQEYEHLSERASEQWEEHEAAPSGEMAAIYKRMVSEAKAAWKNKAFHRALEFARGAGALAKAEIASLRLDEPAGVRLDLLAAGKR